MSNGMGPQQKQRQALDEPGNTENVSKDKTLLLRSISGTFFRFSFKFPTDIFWVLKLSKFLQLFCGQLVEKPNTQTSCYHPLPEIQLTKPGVICPAPIKYKILMKKEKEMYKSNPFQLQIIVPWIYLIGYDTATMQSF